MQEKQVRAASVAVLESLQAAPISNLDSLSFHHLRNLLRVSFVEKKASGVLAPPLLQAASLQDDSVDTLVEVVSM